MFDKSERVHFLEKKWTRSQIDTFGRKINTPHFYSNLHFESKNWNHLTKNTPKINISMGNYFHAIQGKVPIFNISMGLILFRINSRVKPGGILLCSFVAQSDWRHFFKLGGEKTPSRKKTWVFLFKLEEGIKNTPLKNWVRQKNTPLSLFLCDFRLLWNWAQPKKNIFLWRFDIHDQ